MAKDEVLIVGAGPVGLTLAIQLARYGVKFRIIDKSAMQTEDSRAAGIHPRTLEVFEDLGVIDTFLEQGVSVAGINLYSHKKRLIHAVYGGLDSRYPHILDLPQSQTEQILLKRFEALGGKIHRQCTLASLENHDERVDVQLQAEGRTATPDTFAYVIGCDGARSACRKFTETPFPGSEYPTSWIVFDAKMDWPYDPQELHLFLHEEGVIASFPLPHGRMRITIEKGPVVEGEKLPTPTYDEALALLKRRISEEVQFSEPADIGPFIIHHRQVTRYKTGRVFLARDAAHLHSSAGGQGMNTGIQDAYNLGWKLSYVLQGLSDPKILDTYHEERHPIAKDVLSITDMMTKMVTLKNPALSFMRNTMMSLVGNFSSLTKKFPRMLSQLDLKYHPNFILQASGENLPEDLKVGMRIPDHTLKQGGKPFCLFEALHGTHHTLLLFSGKMPQETDLKILSQLYQMGSDTLQPYLIYRNESDLTHCPQKDHCLYDHEPSAHTHYGIEKAAVVIVRPDGIVGMIQSPPDPKGVETYLKKVFKTL